MKKQYYIKLNGARVPVSEKVYRVYMRPVWREKKQAEVREDKEVSYDFMLTYGAEIACDDISPEEQALHHLTADELRRALATLTDDERFLIDELFFNEKSERALSRETGIPRKTLTYRTDKVLLKLWHLIK